MASTGEQGMTGRAPADPGSVKIDMGQGPPSVRRPAPRPAAPGGATIVTSAVLALLFGGAGAWAYERFVAPAVAPMAPETATPQGGGPRTKDLARFDERINEVSEEYNRLSDQYKQLQSRLESIPKPPPAPDLAPLEQKVSQLDRLSQQVEALSKKVEALPQQLERAEQRLAELDARLDESRRSISVERARTPATPSRDSSVNRTDHPSPPPELSSDRTDHPSPPRDERAEGAAPPSEKGSADVSLDKAAGEFRAGRYQEAYDLFRKLLQSQPEDARVWYYAALSYGLATHDWGRATEMMVEEGVSRERAGKPPKSDIDAAFAGLTKETGKEWLDFYRGRAR